MGDKQDTGDRRYCDLHGVYDNRGFCPHCRIAELENALQDILRDVSPPEIVNKGIRHNRYEATYGTTVANPFKRAAALIAEPQADKPKQSGGRCGGGCSN